MKKGIFLRLIISSTLVVAVVYFYQKMMRNKLPNNNAVFCEHTEWSMQQSINGILVNKYKDKKNHDRKTIEVRGIDNKIKKSALFVLERGDGYVFLNIGDSIVKTNNSLELLVYRKGALGSFNLNYGCDSH